MIAYTIILYQENSSQSINHENSSQSIPPEHTVTTVASVAQSNRYQHLEFLYRYIRMDIFL
uniref:Uncharacterized protein n=1 Tax=Arundo donax TaxID=35708 RepID=A0A0A9AVJ9_ARUDO